MYLLDAMKKIVDIIHDQTNVFIDIGSERGVEFRYYVRVESCQLDGREYIELVQFPAYADFQLKNMESILRELFDKMPVISHHHLVGSVDVAEFKACAEEWIKHPNIAVVLFAKYCLKCADWDTKVGAQIKLAKKALKDAPAGWKFEIAIDQYCERYSKRYFAIKGTNSITGFAGEFGKIVMKVGPNGFDFYDETGRNPLGANCSIKAVLESQGLI